MNGDGREHLPFRPDMWRLSSFCRAFQHLKLPHRDGLLNWKRAQQERCCRVNQLTENGQAQISDD